LDLHWSSLFLPFDLSWLTVPCVQGKTALRAISVFHTGRILKGRADRFAS
jgi:hypothetical protein